jgi:NADH-quinone oxidoreductase subunit F
MEQDLDLLTWSPTTSRGAPSALGDAAALPVKSFIKHFRSEFQHHIDNKECIVAPYA